MDAFHRSQENKELRLVRNTEGTAGPKRKTTVRTENREGDLCNLEGPSDPRRDVQTRGPQLRRGRHSPDPGLRADPVT